MADKTKEKKKERGDIFADSDRHRENGQERKMIYIKGGNKTTKREKGKWGGETRSSFRVQGLF